MNVVLLLTGCIKPNVTDYIAVSNSERRQEMYIDAIRWYMYNTPYNIVFAENSGTDVASAIGGGNNERLELLTFKSEPIVPDRSRSYKEMEIMEYAFEHSRFLQEQDLLIVKITGRLKLLNIVQIIKRLQCKGLGAKYGFVSSAKNARKPFSDCRFMYFSRSFWPILLAQKENIWPTYGMEWVMGDAIRQAQKAGLKFVYPPCLELIEGIGMSHGHDLGLYGMSLMKARIKHFILRLLFEIGVLPKDGKN